MGTPPPIFTKAHAQFAVLMEANGLARWRFEYHEASFGSAFAEYRGTRGALRLVWDGKDAALYAEVLIGAQWKDVESAVAGKVLPIDRDQSDERIARILHAVTATLSRGAPA